MRVLFVDDDSSVLKQGKIFLEDEFDDLNIKTVTSAERGVELLEEEEFDAIVSDYQMPEMNGLEFLRTVRNEMNSNIPFIMFTGKGREDVAMDALNLGADRYLQKGGDLKSQYGLLAQAIVREVDLSLAEEKLRKSERRYRQIAENAHDLIAFVDFEGNILYANQTHEDLLGYKPEELVGENIFEFQHPKDVDRVKKRVSENLLSDRELSVEARVKCKDGSYKWLSVLGKALLDDEFNLDKILLVGHDISDRKEMEEKLKKYKAGVEASSDSIYMIDKDYRYIFANDEHVSRLAEDGKIPKKDKDYVIGKKYEDIHSESTLEKHKDNVENVLETGGTQTEEYEFLTKDRWSSRTYSPVRDFKSGEIEAVVVVSKDITERKKAEDKLKESREKYQSLFEYSPIPIWEHDFSEFKKYVDGLKGEVDNLEDYLEKNPEEILNCFEKTKVVDVNESALEHYGASSKEELIENLPSLVSNDIELLKNQIIAMSKGKPQFRGITESISFKGEKKKELLELRVPEQYQNSFSKAYVAIIDITERERAREREEFLQSLLRHDLGNKLQVIRGYLELLEDNDFPGEVGKYISLAMSDLREGVEIIEKIRTLREAQEEEIRDVDVDAAINDAVDEIGDLAEEKSMEVNVECPEEECYCKGGSLLNRVFFNIIENAVQHSEGSKVNIRGGVSGDKVKCVIEDDGKGIPDEEKNKILSKDYTTDEDRGTGLGMFLVKKLLEIYEGSIEVKDSDLGGAKFEVYLQKS